MTLTRSLALLLLPCAHGYLLQNLEPTLSRRALGSAVATSFAVGLPMVAERAAASGGATAGKTTSIPRAKVRYYGRVTQVISEWMGLGPVIDSGDTAAIKKARATFFGDSEESPAAELKSSGYLLAVAFKIDSKIPPDKIQAVKEYKKMMKDVDALKQAMGGKPTEAAKAYAASKLTLCTYLDEVELPPLTDARYKDPASACFFKCDEE